MTCIQCSTAPDADDADDADARNTDNTHRTRTYTSHALKGPPRPRQSGGAAHALAQAGRAGGTQWRGARPRSRAAWPAPVRRGAHEVARAAHGVCVERRSVAHLPRLLQLPRLRLRCARPRAPACRRAHGGAHALMRARCSSSSTVSMLYMYCELVCATSSVSARMPSSSELSGGRSKRQRSVAKSCRSVDPSSASVLYESPAASNALSS